MKYLQRPRRRLVQTFMLAIFLGINLCSRAQVADDADLKAVEASTPIAAGNLPVVGYYYSAKNLSQTAMPGNFYNLPAWDLGGGFYLLSDLDYQPQSSFGMRTRDDDGPPFPGDGGDGGGGTNASGDPFYGFATNNLWMQLITVSNGTAYLNICNATNYVYEIFSETNLGETNWNIETEVFPTNQDVMPFTVPVLDRTNSLFFWARDWTGVTENGNTTPSWWFFYWFGTTELSDTNLDSSGDTLLSDYENGVDPNVITFSLNVTNRFFNTSYATVQISVANGVPYYMAAVVDSTNFATASWTPYTSNFVINLGSAEGWHSVSVGLRGLPPNAQQTWEQIQLKLVLTPPALIVTNPVVGLVTQPAIQLQGYCSDNLIRAWYDLSNSASFETNQQAFVTTRQFDTNNFEYTTNGFECFNIPLANGTNTVTLHATDVAGNMTSTNLVYVFDPTANTNPPIINLSWPQNNASISGTNFLIRGAVNDPFATISVQIVNAATSNGFPGVVEQNGSFWIENLPLGSGTNYLAITATNAAGYSSATNIAVIQSAVTLTITSVTFNDPISPTATVTGALGGSSDAVFVNHVQAANNGDATWTAYYVPVGDSGTATIAARAIACSGRGADSRTTSIFADDAASGGSSASDAETAEDVERASQVAPVQYSWNILEEDVETMGTESVAHIMNWVYGEPGNQLDSDCGTGWYYGTTYEYAQINWNDTGSGPLLYGETNVCGEIGTNAIETGSVTLPGFGASGNMQTNDSDEIEQYHGEFQYQSSYVLKTGGQALSGQQNLWCVNVTLPYYFLSPPLEPSEITVAGQTLDSNYNAWLVLPDNAEVDVTPTAPLPLYGFLVGASEYTLVHQTQCTALGNPDDTRTTIGIGEVVELSGMPINTVWSVSSDGSLDVTNGDSANFTAGFNSGSATVSAQVGSAPPLQVTFGILVPSGTSVLPNSNLGLGATGTNGVGQDTLFDVYIQPDEVSFNNVSFREYATFTNIPRVWPNGTTNWESFSLLPDISVNCNNHYPDNIGDGPYPSSWLYNGTNPAVSFSETFNWMLQYFDGSSQWHTVQDNSTTTTYYGSTLQTVVNYNGVEGWLEGPWENDGQ